MMMEIGVMDVVNNYFFTHVHILNVQMRAETMKRRNKNINYIYSYDTNNI